MTTIPIEWLQHEASVKDFESEELLRKADVFSIPLAKIEAKLGKNPFGHMTDAWKNFTDALEPEDQLWSFSSPEESFAKKLGCSGYAIVREGRICDTLIMVMT